MSVWRLIHRELFHRWGLSLLSLAGAAAAVAVFVVIAMTQDAIDRETTRIQRDLGFNLRIIPKATDMQQFWLDGFASETMSEQTVHKLVAQEAYTYNHLIATLQKRVREGNTEFVLIGVSATFFPPGQRKPPMAFEVQPGTAHVGSEIARRLGAKRGEALTIAGRAFTVERIMPGTGSADDLRVYVNLADAQSALNLLGQINEIRAIDCRCEVGAEKAQAAIQAEIDKFVPDAKAVLAGAMADTRARQRVLVERYAAFIKPVTIFIGAAWIGILAMINIRQRTSELGLLRALGCRSRLIGGLVIGKAIAIGALAAALGFALGSAVAMNQAPALFDLTARSIVINWSLLAGAMIIAPLVAVLAAMAPMAWAVVQDPARTLRHE